MNTVKLTKAQFIALSPYFRTAIDASVLVTRVLPNFKSIIPSAYALRVELVDDPKVAFSSLQDLGELQRAGVLGW